MAPQNAGHLDTSWVIPFRLAKDDPITFFSLLKRAPTAQSVVRELNAWQESAAIKLIQ